jgi:hypothetical protein
MISAEEPKLQKAIEKAHGEEIGTGREISQTPTVQRRKPKFALG